ncbi:hypothetical protein TJA_20480 [Thermus sp. LT1-2-5]
MEVLALHLRTALAQAQAEGRVERDGEVWTYWVWASPYLPEALLAFPGYRQAVWLEREVCPRRGGSCWLGGGDRERFLLGAGCAFPGGRVSGAEGRGLGGGGAAGLRGFVTYGVRKTSSAKTPKAGGSAQGQASGALSPEKGGALKGSHLLLGKVQEG